LAVEREDVSWQKINCTYGVSKILSHRNKSYLVPNALIKSIKEKLNQAGTLVPQKKQFSKNDNVRIKCGPFDDFLATVESINRDQRVWVLINVMGQAARTLIKAEKLEYTD
jgi:transcriptional antiterminator RfaH